MFDRLLPELRDLAARHDLVVELGRSVIEIRSPGVHKGQAVRTIVDELDAGGFLFAGDDLGDLEAFDAVRALGDDGLPTLLVCSSSEEENALLELSDVVVKGPDGVLALLTQLTEDAAPCAPEAPGSTLSPGEDPASGDGHHECDRAESGPTSDAAVATDQERYVALFAADAVVEDDGRTPRRRARPCGSGGRGVPAVSYGVGDVRADDGRLVGPGDRRGRRSRAAPSTCGSGSASARTAWWRATTDPAVTAAMMGTVDDGLSIGEFSRVTHLSIRRLRRYHDGGLLVPAMVDPVDRLPLVHPRAGPARPGSTSVP